MEAPELGPKLTFFCSWYCPFAQRTWITLIEKRIPHKHVDLGWQDTATGFWRSFQETPEWYLNISPLGRVPALAYREGEGNMVQNIYESLVCNEYLEDIHPAPSLWPPHFAVKARARILIHRFDTKFVPLFYQLLGAQDKQAQDTAADGLREELRWLNGAADSAGPFLVGKEFSLADAAVVPWFLRMYVLQHYRGFEIPADFTRLIGWYGHVAQRPSVVATCVASTPGGDYQKELLADYGKYANGSAGSKSSN